MTASMARRIRCAESLRISAIDGQSDEQRDRRQAVFQTTRSAWLEGAAATCAVSGGSSTLSLHSPLASKEVSCCFCDFEPP